MGIDPGLNFTGISLFEIDSYTSDILSIEALTLVNDKLLDRTEFSSDDFQERLIKLYKLKYAFEHVLSQMQPHLIYCEAPFYNRFRPTAYSSLLEVVNTIYAGVLEYNYNIPFHMLAPLSVKKFIGAKTIKNDTEKGKFEVKTAVVAIPEITSVLKNDIHTLTEHAIDSIAVGYTGLKTRGN